MDKWCLISGLVVLGFTIFCGVMANHDYHDPVGIGILIAFAFFAGVAITSSLLVENEATNKENTKEDAKHKVD